MEPLTRSSLNGLWHALILPWTDDDELDEARYIAEIRSYAGAGLAGIYTGGTTGEFYAADDATFNRIAAITCEQGHDIGLPAQIGVTTLSTRMTKARVKTAVKAGADGLQVAWPFWLQPGVDEIFHFMKEVAAAADGVPLILYHTMRAKYKLTPEEIGRLAEEVPSFIGMKDTGCSLDDLKAMLAFAPELSIFGGDVDLIERTEAGGRGGYCSFTGLNVKLVVRMYNDILAGDIESARVRQNACSRLLHEVLVPLIKQQGLMDSALDRMMRQAGGGDVGLRCQGPYKSATKAQYKHMLDWIRREEPMLLDDRG